MINKNFKQKYFLYCPNCETKEIVKKFAQVKNNSYICRIKIEEIKL